MYIRIRKDLCVCMSTRCMSRSTQCVVVPFKFVRRVHDVAGRPRSFRRQPAARWGRHADRMIGNYSSTSVRQQAGRASLYAHYQLEPRWHQDVKCGVASWSVLPPRIVPHVHAKPASENMPHVWRFIDTPHDRDVLCWPQGGKYRTPSMIDQ